MLIDSNVIDIELENLSKDQVFWFNTSKLDAIVQVKNVTAVIVRTYAPDVVPPQTWWIWVDTVWWKAYMAVATNYITDWSMLWVLWWAIWDKKIAVWNSSWNLTSYTNLWYDNSSWILSVPIANISTEYRVWNTKVVWSRQTASYTSDPESSAYTGIDNAQSWTPYAQLTDINALRVAYEALRVWYENLRTALQTHGLIS